jgi:thymidine kinase
MLTVITGPMFAGKTTYLINYLIANAKVGRVVATFKPVKDNRYSEEAIKTHNGAEYPSIPIQSPYEAKMVVKTAPFTNGVSVDIVGFDEAQFFDPTHMQAVVSELLALGVDVVVAGLAQNSFGEPFGAMGSLMAMADEVVQLPAICAQCKVNKATRTYRKSASKDRVLVGGADDYEPRCFNCWRK